MEERVQTASAKTRPNFASDDRRRAAKALFDQGFGYMKAAWILGMSVNTLRDWSRSYKAGTFASKLPMNQFRYDDATRLRAIELRRGGMSWREVAEQTGASVSACRKWVNKEASVSLEKAGSETNRQGVGKVLSDEDLSDFAGVVAQKIENANKAFGEKIIKCYKVMPRDLSTLQSRGSILIGFDEVTENTVWKKLPAIKEKAAGVWESDSEHRKDIARFVVSDWAGIGSLGEDKYSKLCSLSFNGKEDYSFGEEILASFSLVASFANPEKFYVYDIPVAYATAKCWKLFCKNKKKELCFPFWYPENFDRSAFKEVMPKLIADLEKDRIQMGNSKGFYPIYCNFIREVANIYNSDKSCWEQQSPQEIEMSLYVMAYMLKDGSFAI